MPNPTLASFNRTIVLKGERNFFEDVMLTGQAVKPGMIVERINTGGVANIRKHNVAGGRTAALSVACESPLNQGGTVDTVYLDGGVVSYCLPRKGDVINLLLKAGQNIAIGDKLVSDGAGRVQKNTSLSTQSLLLQVIGEADVNLNLLATAAVDTLIPTRIL